MTFWNDGEAQVADQDPSRLRVAPVAVGATGAHAFPQMRFDIADLPVAQQRDCFVDAIDRAYFPCDTQFLLPTLRRARMAGVDFGPVRAGYGDVDPLVVRRGAAQLRRGAGDYVFIPLPLRERLQLCQRGREVWVEQSSFACTATAEAYTYRQPQALELVTLRLAAPAVRQMVPNIEDLTATAFHAQRGAAALFLDYARAFCRNAGGFDRHTGETAMRHLLDLFAIAVLSAVPVGASSETAVRQALRQRIYRLVDTRLRDPDLDTGKIAQLMGLSERQVQKLLSEGTQTLPRLVRQRRLSEACRLLADPLAACRSINAIAYALGFADPAYFSRMFRRATGLSPRAYRAQQLSRDGSPQALITAAGNGSGDCRADL